MKFFTLNGKEYTKEQITSCAIDAYRGVSTKAEYTAEQRKETMQEVLAELGKNYRDNKNKIFQIIEATLDEVLPEKTNEFIMFAEVKNFKFNQTMRFKVSSKTVKAYSVALGGTVRRTRMDSRYVTITAENIQAKVYEEMLNIKAGNVDFQELIDACVEAITDEINQRIYQTVMGTYQNLPTPNKHEGAGIDESELLRLTQVVDSYGKAVIYGTKRGLASLTSCLDKQLASEADKMDLRDRGYLGTFRGTPVYEIKNPVADESNESFLYDDSYLFIIPQGKEAYVKVGFEGDAFVKDRENADWTVDFDIAKRVGIAVLVTNHIAIYKNTALAE